MMNGLKLGLLLFGLLIATNIAGWDDIEWIFYSGLALLLIAFVWARASLIGVGLRRTLDTDRVFVDDEVRERFRATNRSRIPKTWITFQDRSTLPGHASSSAIAIKGRSETIWTNRTMANQRGRFRLGPIELRSGDPFGLFSQRRTLDLTHEVLVYPRLVPLPGPSTRGGELGGGTRVAPGRSSSAPVIRSLRQYVIGDPMNQIAWRSSARHGALLVKELEPDPITDEWILLDLAPVQGRGGRKSVEYAVSLTASFALEWLDAARDVGLLVNRTIPAIVDADAGDRQRFRILETLAIVEPYGEANPASLIARFASRFSRSTSLIVISTGSGSDLVRPLQHLAQRGVPMLVFAVGEPGGSLASPGWSSVESSGIPVTRLNPDGAAVDTAAVSTEARAAVS